MHCWPKGEFVLAVVVGMGWRLNCYDNNHTWKHNLLLENFLLVVSIGKGKVVQWLKCKHLTICNVQGKFRHGLISTAITVKWMLVFCDIPESKVTRTALSGKSEPMEGQRKALGTINVEHVRQPLGKVECLFFFFSSQSSGADEFHFSLHIFHAQSLFKRQLTISSLMDSKHLPPAMFIFLLASFLSLWPFEFSTCQVLKLLSCFVEFKEWFLYGYCFWGTWNSILSAYFCTRWLLYSVPLALFCCKMHRLGSI